MIVLKHWRYPNLSFQPLLPMGRAMGMLRWLSIFLFSVFDRFSFVPQPNIPFRPLHGWGRSSFTSCLFYQGCRIYLIKRAVHVSNILRRGNIFGPLHYLCVRACVFDSFSDVQCGSVKNALHIFSSLTWPVCVTALSTRAHCIKREVSAGWVFSCLFTCDGLSIFV